MQRTATKYHLSSPRDLRGNFSCIILKRGSTSGDILAIVKSDDLGEGVSRNLRLYNVLIGAANKDRFFWCLVGFDKRA